MLTIIKTIRDAAVRTPGVQPFLKMAARSGLVGTRVLDRLAPLGTHRIAAPDGREFRYVASADDQVARKIIWQGFGRWEATTVPVFYKLAGSARGFLDIGAYSGIYTLLACTANPTLAAVAFEPNPDAYRMLSANIVANRLGDRVSAVQSAVSDTSGSVILRIPDDTTAATIVGPYGRAIEVSMVRADEATPAQMTVDLVKIDVEGAEAAVLRSMGRLLDTRPVIIVECLGTDSFTAVRALLERHGYELFHYLGPSGPVTAAPGLVIVPRFPNFLCR